MQTAGVDDSTQPKRRYLTCTKILGTQTFSPDRVFPEVVKKKFAYLPFRNDSEMEGVTLQTSRKRFHATELVEEPKLKEMTLTDAQHAASSVMPNLSDTSVWKCFCCKQIYASFSMLQTHIIQREHGIKLFACNFCCHGFTTKRSLIGHQCQSATWEVYLKENKCYDKNDLPLSHFYHFIVCSDCGIHVLLSDSEKDRLMYRQIQRVHDEKNLRNVVIYLPHQIAPSVDGVPISVDFTPWLHKVPLSCKACGTNYHDVKDVERHGLKHAGHNPFRCPECSKTFGSEMFFRHHLLFDHMADKGNLVAFMQSYPDESLYENLNGNKRKQQIQTDVQCDLCGETEDPAEFNVVHDCAISFTRRLLVRGKLIRCPGITPQPISVEVDKDMDNFDVHVTFAESLKKEFHLIAKFSLNQSLPELVEYLEVTKEANKDFICCRVCCAVLVGQTKFNDHMTTVHRATNLDPALFYFKLHRGTSERSLLGCPKCDDSPCSMFSLRRHLVVQHGQWIPEPEMTRTAPSTKYKPVYKFVQDHHDHNMTKNDSNKSLRYPAIAPKVFTSASTPIPASSSDQRAVLVARTEPINPVPTIPIQSTTTASTSVFGSGSWLCPICRIRFPDMEKLRIHLQAAHINICFKCAACYVSEKSLITHQTKCFQLRVDALYFCYLCGTSTKELGEYYRHLVHEHSNRVSFDDASGQIFPMCGALLNQPAPTTVKPGAEPSTNVCANADGKDEVTVIEGGKSSQKKSVNSSSSVSSSSTAVSGNNAKGGGVGTISSEANCSCYFCATEKPRSHMATHITHNRCVICDLEVVDPGSLIDHVVKSHLTVTLGYMYDCSLCGTSFTNSIRAANHIFLRCVKLKTFACQLCGVQFNNPDEQTNRIALEQHWHTAHSELFPKCKLCGRLFSWKPDCDTHMNDEHRAGPHACNMCKKTFNDKDALMNHQVTHMGSLSFCMICKSKFSTVRSFKDHLEQHKARGERTKIRASASEILVTSKSPSRRAKNKIALVVEFENEEDAAVENSGPNQIEIAPERNTSNTSASSGRDRLEIAMSAEVGADSPMDTTSPAEEVDDDVVILEDEEGESTTESQKKRAPVHRCKICSQAFQTLLALRHHQQTHAYDAGQTTEEVLSVPNLSSLPLYVCRLCSLAYECPTVFRQHNLKHGEPLACSSCTAVCFTPQQLQQHTTAHAEKKIVYGCSLCFKAFATEEKLHQHLSAVHGYAILWLCKLCGYGRVDKRSVIDHMNTSHRTDIGQFKSRPCMLGVCALRKLHFQPRDVAQFKANIKAYNIRERPGECVHRSFLTYNETLLACETCGTMVPATKMVLESERLKSMGSQIKLAMTDDPYERRPQFTPATVAPTVQRPTFISSQTSAPRLPVGLPGTRDRTLVQTSSTGSSRPAGATATVTARPLNSSAVYFNVGGKSVSLSADSLNRLFNQSTTSQPLNVITTPSVTHTPPSVTPITNTVATGRPVTNVTPIAPKITQKTDTVHKCKVCDKVMPTGASLKVHQLRHIEAHSWFCLECGISFSDKSQLGLHFDKRHSMKAIYNLKCPIPQCAFRTQWINSFRLHLRTHINPGSLNAHLSLKFVAGCGIRFATESAKDSHEANHTNHGIGSSSSSTCCILCGSCFSTETQLSSHVALHASIQWFMCRECGLCYPTSQQLHDHFESEHKVLESKDDDGKLLNSCSICKSTLASNRDGQIDFVWRMHMKGKHQVLGYKLKPSVSIDGNFNKFIGLDN